MVYVLSDFSSSGVNQFLFFHSVVIMQECLKILLGFL